MRTPIAHGAQLNEAGIIHARDILDAVTHEILMDAACRYCNADREARHYLHDVVTCAERITRTVEYTGWHIPNDADTVARLAVKVGERIEARNNALHAMLSAVRVARMKSPDVTLEMFVTVTEQFNGEPMRYPHAEGGAR